MAHPDNIRKGQLILPANYRWGVFVVSTIVMFLITMIILGMLQATGILGSGISRSSVLTSSLLQGLLVFIMPTVLTWYLTSKYPWHEPGIDVMPGWRNILRMLLLYAVSFPAMNQVVWFNQHIQLLPDPMSGLEAALRTMEERAQLTTQTILADTSAGAMIVNVLIIGIFTGTAEEMFFRGGIQRMMQKSGLSAAWSIWLAALIFSAVHMQFYGFIPRLLLGAMFGYVYWQSGSIWISASMHALNNSLVVVCAWLQSRGLMSTDIDNLFVTESGFCWWFVVSAFLTIALIIYRKAHGK